MQFIILTICLWWQVSRGHLPARECGLPHGQESEGIHQEAGTAAVGLAGEQRRHEPYWKHLEDVCVDWFFIHFVFKQVPALPELAGYMVSWSAIEGECQIDDPADAGASCCCRQGARWMDKVLIRLKTDCSDFFWKTVLYFAADILPW